MACPEAGTAQVWSATEAVHKSLLVYAVVLRFQLQCSASAVASSCGCSQSSPIDSPPAASAPAANLPPFQSRPTAARQRYKQEPEENSGAKRVGRLKVRSTTQAVDSTKDG